MKQSFGPYLRGTSGHDWTVEYPDGGRGEIYCGGEEGEQIDGFMVSRPPIHPVFWKNLFNLMKATSGCVYWPGGGCVIADPSVRAHVDPELIEALGEPRLVTTPTEMLDR
jgi:hypothetical protein